MENPGKTGGVLWSLLTPEETDILDDCGIKRATMGVEFSRDLSEKEIGQAFAICLQIRERSLRHGNDQANFAVGDVLNEAQRLLGEAKSDEMLGKILEFHERRDPQLIRAGATLIYLQQVEHLIKSCCALMKIKITVEELFGAERKKIALGALMRGLMDKQLFRPDFEATLDSFIQKRNEFVHSLWMHIPAHSGDSSVPAKTELDFIDHYLTDLLAQASKVEAVFRGMYMALYVGSGRSENDPDGPRAGHVRWLKYIPEFFAAKM